MDEKFLSDRMIGWEDNLLLRQWFDKCDLALMVVPNPQAGETARPTGGLQVNVSNICFEWKQVVIPPARFDVKARDAIGGDASRPGVALVVVMGVIGKEIRRHCVDRHLLPGRLARVEHSNEVSVVSSPPQTVLRIADATPHTA